MKQEKGAKVMNGARITYFAVALNPQGHIGQLLVIRENGQQVSQEWTGVIYRSEREAERDLARLNMAS